MVGNYWIFKVKDETGGLYGRRGNVIFEHRTEEGFWAIRERSENGKQESNVALLQKGDYALFYLVRKEGSIFVGTCVLVSGFTQLSEEQAKTLVHKEYIDWHQGVFIKDVDKWVKPLSIGYLRGKESLAQGGVNVGSHFQGSIKKISRNDYNVILHEHELVL